MQRPLPCWPGLAAAALALAGCVPGDDFPSLAPRPAERDLSTEDPERPQVAVPDDPGLRAGVEALRAEAAAGERAFEAAYPAAAAAVAAAGPPESDGWVAAQQALSRLEAARARTMRALAELDRLAVAGADRPTSAADFAAIEAAIAAAGRLATGQQQRFDGLRTRLSGR